MKPARRDRRAAARRIGSVIVLLLVGLAIVTPPFVPRVTGMQGAGASCGSPQHAAVADRVAAVFDEHRFVFIGSTHGGGKRHEFLLCLLGRPGLQRRVTNVLVEWANPVHQRLMDRYLLALEQMPQDSLRQVWFDTDAPQLWARLPQVPAFFDAVREINARLEPPRRLRVLGGSEPVNWSRVRSAEDIATYPFKTNWAAQSSPSISPSGPKNGCWWYPRDLFYAADEPLVSYVDAVVYLGPKPDGDLAGQIELTAAQRADRARREALKGDRRRLMELRFGRRDLWFQDHPNDLPERPGTLRALRRRPTG